MKYISLFFIQLILSWSCFGQMIIDAGQDTSFCYTGDIYYSLGGNPTADLGSPPYTYTWESKILIEGTTIYASDFMDDTTLANPSILIPSFNGKLNINLTVKSSDNNQKKDSIILYISLIKIQTLLNLTSNISKGESVQLCACNTINGIEPFTYKWSPDYKLSNTTIEAPYANPDSSLKYKVIVTDSIGCVAEDVYFVNVTDINKIKESGLQHFFEVFPNPITDNSILRIQNSQFSIISIEIYNSFGQKINSLLVENKELNIGDYIKTTGVFILKITISNTLSYFMKIIRNHV